MMPDWLGACVALSKLVNQLIALAQQDQYKLMGRTQAFTEVTRSVTEQVRRAAAIRAQAAQDLQRPGELRADDGMQRPDT